MEEIFINGSSTAQRTILTFHRFHAIIEDEDRGRTPVTVQLQETHMLFRTITATAFTLVFLANSALAEGQGNQAGTTGGFPDWSGPPPSLFERGAVAQVDAEVIDLSAELDAVVAEYCAEVEEDAKCVLPEDVKKMIAETRITRIRAITDAMAQKSQIEAVTVVAAAQVVESDALGLVRAARVTAGLPASAQAEHLQEKVASLETQVGDLREDLAAADTGNTVLEAALAAKEDELTKLRAKVEELEVTKAAAERITEQRDTAIVALEEAARFAHTFCNNGEGEGADFTCDTLFGAEPDDAPIHFLKWAEDQAKED